ncbi:hypothetical protein OIU85_002720 [Salix viminalis]|uniref:Uncharacterized protein n=1 Tax=Salix viminalis TaxID=40686 RepID=A0A9Q0VPN0_SALVM|nr:hypothetical protein OIU85_002720 [Salix viminalis]
MRWVSGTEGGESLQARDETEGQRRETRWVALIEARDEMGFRDRERRETTQRDRGGEGRRGFQARGYRRERNQKRKQMQL